MSLPSLRNKLIHDRDFNAIPDRPGFIFAFHESLRGLQAIIKSRQPAEEQDAAGDQYCVIC